MVSFNLSHFDRPAELYNQGFEMFVPRGGALLCSPASLSSLLLFLATISIATTAAAKAKATPLQDSSFPLPFYRPLQLQSPPLEGSDILILQNFLRRTSVCVRWTRRDEGDENGEGMHKFARFWKR